MQSQRGMTKRDRRPNALRIFMIISNYTINHSIDSDFFKHFCRKALEKRYDRRYIRSFRTKQHWKRQ